MCKYVHVEVPESLSVATAYEEIRAVCVKYNTIQFKIIIYSYYFYLLFGLYFFTYLLYFIDLEQLKSTFILHQDLHELN